MSRQRSLVFITISALLGLSAGGYPVTPFAMLAFMTLPLFAIRGFMRLRAVVAFGVGTALAFAASMALFVTVESTRTDIDFIQSAGFALTLLVIIAASSTLVNTAISLAVYGFRRRFLSETVETRALLEGAARTT